MSGLCRASEHNDRINTVKYGYQELYNLYTHRFHRLLWRGEELLLLFDEIAVELPLRLEHLVELQIRLIQLRL